MKGAGATLAIIPARGGSKRIPRKNIRAFLGVPLLARTIGLLQSAQVFDRIVVSTDDEEIESVALAAGAEVPFRRPPELANDMAATIPVIQHGVKAMHELGFNADFVCCAYPAAVLASAVDLRTSLDMLRESASDYVFTGTSFPYPIQRALRQLPDGSTAMFWPEHRQTRSQDLEPAFHDAGQFYWGRAAAWLEARALFTQTSRMLVLPRFRVQDIDNEEDWERAELIYKLLQRDA